MTYAARREGESFTIQRVSAGKTTSATTTGTFRSARTSPTTAATEAAAVAALRTTSTTRITDGGLKK